VFLSDLIDVVEAAGVGLVERAAAAAAVEDEDNKADAGDDGGGVYRCVIKEPSSVELCRWSFRRTILAGPCMLLARPALNKLIIFNAR